MEKPEINRRSEDDRPQKAAENRGHEIPLTESERVTHESLPKQAPAPRTPS